MPDLMQTLKDAAVSIDKRVLHNRGRQLRDAYTDKRSTRMLRRSTGNHQEWFELVPSSELKRLCDLHGSDKGSTGESATPYPWAAHNYADVYAMLFEHCRRQIRMVFECGIGTNNEDVTSNMTSGGRPGASLRVWRDYFPNAEVHGADIDSQALFTEERIQTFLLDQTDPEAVRQLWESTGLSGFDLMIDDGLHEYDAAICLFENSIAQLGETGLYVIEDVRPPDMPAFVDYFSRTSYWTTQVLMHRGPGVPTLDNSMIIVRPVG